ncbi:sugar-binding transcriptional regulator [Tessaracoccus caeni]|uniref:sugar-binding transcriptional regulator n=1 Tax=Tessaracoccus caeni TaxID=3031239 RepID=UPI0023DAEE0E|nr:sugar-binding domain-containing protein [Tessaracoccus caeni]MDF1489315.1 sugar-binding domain-containing protein [Tessaracoccus caeni]
MPAKRDQQLLIDAARMYYVEGLDQGQVGRRLGLSRSGVSRILAKARELGVVQVRIIGDEHVSRNRDLERALVRKFGLREALVAETSSESASLRAVGQLASQVFTRRSATATRIGLSWGFTVGQLVEAIPQVTLRSATKLTPLVGGMPLLDTGPSGNSYIQTLAEKCGVSAERFDAPAVVESAATFHAMMSESTVRGALARARDCDLAFVGIGSFGVQTSKQTVDAMHLTEAEWSEVLRAKPVGDLAGRLFDIEGNPLGPPASERVIGTDIDEIREMQIATGLAAGKEKAPGVLGALRTGAFDILVVDEALAATVLSMATARE